MLILLFTALGAGQAEPIPEPAIEEHDLAPFNDLHADAIRKRHEGLIAEQLKFYNQLDDLRNRGQEGWEQRNKLFKDRERVSEEERALRKERRIAGIRRGKPEAEPAKDENALARQTAIPRTRPEQEKEKFRKLAENAPKVNPKQRQGSRVKAWIIAGGFCVAGVLVAIYIFGKELLGRVGEARKMRLPSAFEPRGS
jgi:hypothetical protein